MKFWVGTTDNAWFKHLKSIRADEVNFWQPSAKAPFVNAPKGMPFLFKLKRPYNHIAGGGYFVTYTQLPLAVAWDAFGEKNGRTSFQDFRSVLGDLRGRQSTDDNVGCTILSNTFFLDEAFWIPNPPGWSNNIVVGKYYETANFDGMQIWSQMRDRFLTLPQEQTAPDEKVPLRARESLAAYGAEALVKQRLGQGAFRVLVTDAYRRRCAITGEKTLVALEAAHIVPFAKEQNHDVNNGLLLRADFHRLFDVGLVGVTPDLNVRISPRIREAWSNGQVYYRLDGKPVAVLPERGDMQPDRDRLKWHYDNVFQA